MARNATSQALHLGKCLPYRKFAPGGGDSGEGGVGGGSGDGGGGGMVGEESLRNLEGMLKGSERYSSVGLHGSADVELSGPFTVAAQERRGPAETEGVEVRGGARDKSDGLDGSASILQAAVAGCSIN